MISVAVLGAGGRMGRLVCRAVLEDPDLDLAADPANELRLTHLSALNKWRNVSSN